MDTGRWTVEDCRQGIGAVGLQSSIDHRPPYVYIAWSDVWLGAIVTSLLFSVGKLLIGLYIGNTSLGSSFGAAGSLVILLVWVYYSAQILFLGAEFTQVYANSFGSRIQPLEALETSPDQ